MLNKIQTLSIITLTVAAFAMPSQVEARGGGGGGGHQAKNKGHATSFAKKGNNKNKGHQAKNKGRR